MAAIPISNNPATPRPSLLAEVWYFLRRSPGGLAGLMIIAVHLLIAVTAPVIVPYDPLALDSQAILQAPSWAHWFGTDELGRDVFARTLMGGRLALLITLTGIVIAVLWGGVVGIMLGLLGGWWDEIGLRLVDALLSIPQMLFLLLIAGIVGTDAWILILSLGFLYGVEVIRIARAATLSVVAQDFVLAARARGESYATIVLRELLPNVLDILLIEGALRWAWMLLAFSALSFLGFGVAPPTPDWGLMIAQNRDSMGVAPWATFFPIIALSSLIVGGNLLVGALAKAIGLDRSSGSAVA